MDRKQLRIRWIVFLFLFALSLTAISFFGGTVSYSFFFAVLMLPAACLIYLLIVYVRFRIYQEIGSRTIVSGQPVSYFFTLENEDKIAFSSVYVRFYSDFSQIEKLPDNPEYELLPGDRYTYETRVICKYRGEYEVGVKDVVLTDFIGLFRIRYRFPGSIRAVVYPKIVDIQEIQALQNLSAKMPLEIRDPLGVPDTVLRDYVPGDPVKLISWRKSAGLDVPKVRQSIREEKYGAALILDGLRPDGEERETFLPAENKLLEIVIAIGLYCAKNRVPCSVYETGKEIPVRIRTMEDFRQWYEMSQSITFGRRPKIEAFISGKGVGMELKEAQVIFMAVRELSPELVFMADALTSDGSGVIIYSVTEHALPEYAAGHSDRLMITAVHPDRDLREVL